MNNMLVIYIQIKIYFKKVLYFKIFMLNLFSTSKNMNYKNKILESILMRVDGRISHPVPTVLL